MRRKCDGETIFGFTVKACDQEATHINVHNGVHEYYNFCEKHFQHYLHGSEPTAEQKQAVKPSTNHIHDDRRA